MTEPTIAGEDLELFQRSVRAATEVHSGDELDTAVADLGWDDALSFDTRAAVSTLFELQGEACARSSALDRVVAFALGRELDGDTAVVMPAIGRTDAPVVHGVVRGLATSARSSYLVVGSTVDARSLETRTIRGIDPDLGMVEVHGTLASTDREPVDWNAAVQLAQLALAHELVGVSRQRVGDGA